LLPLLVHPDRLKGDKKLTTAIVNMAERVGQDAFQRQQKAIMARLDSRDGLRRIKCPTLALCGRQDSLTPVEVHEEMAGTIDHARLAIIEDCGHMSTMEQPQAVTALLRNWLLYS
jgi:pimeloyl-ACP methyl ester carboxylesterase